MLSERRAPRLNSETRAFQERLSGLFFHSGSLLTDRSPILGALLRLEGLPFAHFVHLVEPHPNRADDGQGVRVVLKELLLEELLEHEPRDEQVPVAIAGGLEQEAMRSLEVAEVGAGERVRKKGAAGQEEKGGRGEVQLPDEDLRELRGQFEDDAGFRSVWEKMVSWAAPATCYRWPRCTRRHWLVPSRALRRGFGTRRFATFKATFHVEAIFGRGTDE